MHVSVSRKSVWSLLCSVLRRERPTAEFILNFIFVVCFAYAQISPYGKSRELVSGGTGCTDVLCLLISCS
jgi:hypothetical protein